ncbi:MAG: shikimate dehydrogenase [Anaerolineales bacterium]|nr:shikimate dehydrogenase [Anaerolineales bacterium]
MTITSKTQLVGIIGWPVSHSRSPAMQNAAFAHAGLDWQYVPLPVAPEPPGRVAEAVAGLRGLGFRGANVTVPHKQAVMPSLDRLTPAAAAIGAVNTILIQPDGALVGDNTDAPGFVADLVDHAVTVAGRACAVLGAGGSARAIVYGLAEAGAQSIVILNRTEARAQTLVDDMQPRFSRCSIVAARLPDALEAIAPHIELIVNCTSLGMTPGIDGTPWPANLTFRPEHVVYDLVYNPTKTRLLQQAAVAGARAIGGIGMLVWQGAIAFERWTGQPAPVEIMRATTARL